MSLKQKKITFRPRIKLTHNIYINKFIFLDFSVESWGGGVENSCCCHKKDQTVKLGDKVDISMNFFLITLNKFSVLSEQYTIPLDNSAQRDKTTEHQHCSL